MSEIQTRLSSPVAHVRCTWLAIRWVATRGIVVTGIEGEMLVDAWLAEAAEADMFAVFDASTQAITPGSRNATLSRFAGRVLVRYGDTPQARELFDRKAGLCEPPLPVSEVEQIWESARCFAAKVAADPGYLSPEAYAALNRLKPEDFSDVGLADTCSTP